MSLDQIKISYSANQLRLRLTFPNSVVLDSPAAPDVFAKRATAKFEAELKAEKLGFYEVYGDEFATLWTNIREKVQQDASLLTQETTYTLGCGAPILDQLQIDLGDGEKVAFNITIEGEPSEIKTWRFDFVRMNVDRKLKELGFEGFYNQAHLFVAWYRAGRGERAFNRPVALLSATEEKPYSVVANKARGEITLVVRKAETFRDRKLLENILNVCLETSKKLTIQCGFKVDFLHTQMLERFKSAVHGPEFFGLKLPAAYLVALPNQIQPDAPEVIAAAEAAKAEREAKRQEEEATAAAEKSANYQGKGLLQIVVDTDQMAAIVGSFDNNLYSQTSFKVDLDWVKKEMALNWITYNGDSALEEVLATAIKEKKNLSGVMLARGTPSVPPKEAYLAAVFKESKIASQPNDAVVNMREAQQRDIVKAGAVIAEVRHSKPGQAGTNVYGQTLPIPEGEYIEFTCGEGVEKRGRQAIASTDGMPKIEDNVVSLVQVLLHNGDVNLRTGNIHFSGSAEIKGSIDSGATVTIDGDLIVHGEIRDAYVRVGGNLEARGGVVTGMKGGLVKVFKDIKASFAENSRIICSGNIQVLKSLTNCQIHCGGDILVEKTGILGGGAYYSSKNISTGKMGFPSGAATEVFAGINWRAKRSSDIRLARFKKLEESFEAEKANLRELARKKDAQKTKKHEEQMVSIQEKINRYKTILEKAKKVSDQAKLSVTFNKDARIYVYGTLHSNIKAEVGGVPIAVTQDVLEVMLSPKRIRGSNIIAIADAEAENNNANNAGAANTAATDKKAS